MYCKIQSKILKRYRWSSFSSIALTSPMLPPVLTHRHCSVISSSLLPLHRIFYFLDPQCSLPPIRCFSPSHRPSSLLLIPRRTMNSRGQHSDWQKEVWTENSQETFQKSDRIRLFFAIFHVQIQRSGLEKSMAPHSFINLLSHTFY